MAYDWEGNVQGGAGATMDIGYHKVTGTKVVHGVGSKAPWLMLIVENDEGQEASAMFTLSDKAAWTLARWLSRCGVDLKALKAEGIEPKHFDNDDIANQYLVGKSCWVRVEQAQNPKYRDLTPLTEDEAKSEAPQAFVGKKPEVPLIPCPVHKNEPCPKDCLDSIPFGLLAMVPTLGFLLA